LRNTSASKLKGQGERYQYSVECVWEENLRIKQDAEDEDPLTDDFKVEGEVLLDYVPTFEELHDVILKDIIGRHSQQHPETSP
jgi:hypothetical protein